ncbi:MAG: lipoprotein-releasing ABC transporter permease subunit [Candidatus Thiodiazotropha sp. (ex Ctena orbiculata)]|nr:lipoprotein-releasing ABC transporter permease subunit [Candidatus Thiodiazotropha taylori]MBT2998158.1 lipoprotein-releasing ABC transporter permease subunit [Candidatus Thiodiazotropha taylori]MBT3002457.1 lipoprotein-releasing ABC transporter permease subunit [Candidatus Thiodiazotropha taylori]MBV2108063.1 lipoprotein-releasing ABC transporter permease subunit [Candidatus Thiodiazotropha taylori]MBV2112756.1 lipoprotein-releasing ABC transporter permease subunit [Candidatus Thiodiazotrop
MFKPIEFYIGLRYTRAKRRNHFISFISLISMLGIMLGVVALIVVISVMNGFHKEVRERILGMTSHATISGVNGELNDWSEVQAEAATFPHVVGEAPYVEGQGMLISGQKVSGVLLRGILPEQEGKVSEVLTAITHGSVEALQAGQYGLILGRELALVLGVGVGDRVTLVTPQVNVTPAGIMPRLKRFTVVAVFQVGMGEYDRGVAIMHIEDAAKLMRLESGVSGIRLKLDDLYLAPQVSRELALKMGGYYRISDWTMQHRNFFAALQTEKRMMTIILSLIVAVAAFNIVSTMVMVVTDKQSDIAILRTLGASPRSIMGIFMVQGATIGIVGNLLGMIGGVLLAINVEEIVSWIESAFEINFLDPNIYYINKLPSDPHLSDVLFIGLAAFVITILATLYPAWKASRTQPAEALRYE